MDNRRTFLQQSAAAVSLAALAGATSAAKKKPAPRQFKLRYAPHFGMFKEHAGPDPIAQLEFMAAQGFTALEDNGWDSFYQSGDVFAEFLAEQITQTQVLYEEIGLA